MRAIVIVKCGKGHRTYCGKVLSEGLNKITLIINRKDGGQEIKTFDKDKALNISLTP